MLNNKKILAVIPARGGSKGVPRKNIRLAGGKPLIAWVILAAKQSLYIDHLIISSDDQEIIDTARRWGCEAPFVRPDYLAKDESKTVDVILHALQELPGYDYVVTLQPTSPLIATEDIDGCIEKCLTESNKSCITVTEPGKSPFWMFTMAENDRLCPLFGSEYLIKRRQELPKAFIPNGAVFCIECNWLTTTRKFYSEDTLGYIVPKERSLDIDTEMDLQIVDTVLASIKK